MYTGCSIAHRYLRIAFLCWTGDRFQQPMPATYLFRRSVCPPSGLAQRKWQDGGVRPAFAFGPAVRRARGSEAACAFRSAFPSVLGILRAEAVLLGFVLEKLPLAFVLPVHSPVLCRLLASHIYEAWDLRRHK